MEVWKHFYHGDQFTGKGVADVKKQGKDITIVATLFMVHRVLGLSSRLKEEGIDVEVIDLRTLVPLDKEAIINSVKKTGRLVIVSEDCQMCGVGAEISAMIADEAFDYLDGPIKRVSTMNTPIPFSPKCEEYVLPNEKRILDAIYELCK